MAVLSLGCCAGFSVVAASGGYSLVAVTSLVAEHRFRSLRASVVADPEL